MALTTYQTQTNQLLQNPGVNAVLIYPTTSITQFINRARKQIAGEALCIRNYATLAVTSSSRKYGFSSVTLGSPTTGIGGIFNIRQALVGIGDGLSLMTARSWPWFTTYKLNNIVPPSGTPTEWSQFGQGITGNIFIDPLPDASYTLTLDTVCYPIDLVDDLTAEAIPYPWTECVPFFAAYYALLSAQRVADAEQMFKRYQMFMDRARGMSNPDQLPQNYLQSVDPTMKNKLGMTDKG